MAEPGPRYLLAFDTFRLPHHLTDVLVVGTGVAGYSAALAAAAAGARVLAAMTRLYLTSAGHPIPEELEAVLAPTRWARVATPG